MKNLKFITKKTFIIILCFSLNSQTKLFSQGETWNWVFGTGARIKFPSLVQSPSSILTLETSASISDAAGNLLFYTDGINVWNQLDAIMPNGTGLLGHISASQGAMIVKQPGSANLYYIFTLDELGGPNGLRYSIVDMSLDVGKGQVTVKNVLLQTPSTEKLTAVRHCNNVDVWIVSHDVGTNNFRSFLLSASGIGAPVVSAAGTVIMAGGPPFQSQGHLKSSPDGTKLGSCIMVLNRVELFDFNRSTGVVCNPITLSATFSGAYGCEFSPDGTKFYAGSLFNGQIRQWNLTAGSPALIIASNTLVGINPSNSCGSMQLAPNGKIYINMFNSNLAVINNPNLSACNYNSITGLFTGTSSTFDLPNFPASVYFPNQTPQAVVTTTIASTACNCNGAVTLSLTGCSLAPLSYYYSNGVQTLNTAALSNSLTNLCAGVYNYTVTAACSNNFGTFTIGGSPNTTTVNISVTPANCSSSTGSVTINSVSGVTPTYTIIEGATPIANNINVPFTISGVTVGTHIYTLRGSGGCSTSFSVSVWAETVTVTPTANLFCNSNTATLSAGSNNALATYTWSGPGIVSGINSTNPLVNQAGTYTVGFTYGSCTGFSLVTVTQNTTVPINVSGNFPLTCVNFSSTLTAVSAGNNLVWNGGVLPSNAANPATVNAPGNYTITATNTLTGCSSSSLVTITQNTIAPALSFSLDFGTSFTLTCTNLFIQISGFSSGASVFFTPSGSNPLTVSSPGSFTSTATNPVNGCKTTSVLTISQNTIAPNRAATVSNSITCFAPTATLTGTSITPGVTFSWSPLGATTPTVSTSIPGSHTLTVTNPINGCTSSTVVAILNSTAIPTITASANRTLTCINTTAVTLTAVSAAGNTIRWDGGALSNATNPATVTAGGVYTATATNTLGCSGSTLVTVIQNTTALTIIDFCGAPTVLTCLIINIKPDLCFLSSNGDPLIWNGPGLSNASNPTITVAGNYTASVINSANGCQTFSVYTILTNTTNANATISNSLSCANPTALLTGTSTAIGTNFYTWFPGGANTNTLLVTAPGNYTLQVVNNTNGCPIATTVITVSGSTNSLTLIPNTTDADCANPTGTVSIGITGGAPNYTITEGGVNIASGAVSSYTLTGVSLGSHTFVISSSNSCN
ncbi:MAG: beta strand repeat-containing protein, partial [Bacteroidota bacterium]